MKALLRLIGLGLGDKAMVRPLEGERAEDMSVRSIFNDWLSKDSEGCNAKGFEQKQKQEAACLESKHRRILTTKQRCHESFPSNWWPCHQC